MNKIKEGKSFFDTEETINYKSFNNYSLNGCNYKFDDLFYDSDKATPNYYKLNKNNGKYKKININQLSNTKYFKSKDINGNIITIIIN